MRRALVLALLAASLLPLRARAQTITAAPGGSMSSLVGVPFDVPIYVDMTARTEKLGSFAANIQWNPAVLHLDGGSDGTFGTVTVNEDTLAGVVHVAGANPAGVGGMITLGILHFTPLLSQVDTVHLAVTELFAAGTFADLTSSLVVHDGYFCPARGMLGDIDKDGSINSRDALIALSNAVGLDVSAFDIGLGDVDANGLTNARDALIILSSAVGLSVGPYRVGALVGGSCSASGPFAMAIVPDTVDLVVGQTVAFEARASNGAGGLQTVTDAIWKSGNTAALAVFPDGKALARDTGTVRVTAIRTALDSAQAVVRIVAHRFVDIVDAAAMGAKNQLGSAAFPFATIGQGIAFAQGGDTVEVRVGRYPESVLLDRQIVLLGDTLADGTRPQIALDSAASYAGINFLGSGTAEATNFDVEGYYAAVDVLGPSHVTLRGLRATGAEEGVVVDSMTGYLRLEASRLTGLGTSAYGYGVLANTFVDTLVIQGTEISDFGDGGVWVMTADSIAVLQSLIQDVGGNGITVTQFFGECGFSCGLRGAPAPRRSASVLGPLAPAFTMSGTTVARTTSDGVYLDPVRSAAFSHNRLLGAQGTSVWVYPTGTGSMRFTGDSIDQGATGPYWLYVGPPGLDDLVMDSVWVRLPGYSSGRVYDVQQLSITNSQFVDARSQVLYVGTSSGNGVAVLDNVSVVGDPACDLCADGFSFGGEKVSVDRLTAINAGAGISSVGDSSLTVTNSLFRHVYAPIVWSGAASVASSRLTVGTTAFDGFYQAIEANGGAVVVDNNTFDNGGYWAISASTQAPLRVTRNRITNSQSAVQVSASTAGATFADTIADNVITDMSYEGIYADGGDTVSFQILRNSVTCNQVGRGDGDGIDLEYGNGTVANNQVSGCYSGIYAYDDGSPRADTVVANTVSIPGGSTWAGIYVEGSIKSRIAYNVVSGDTTGSSSYGEIRVSGSTYQPGPTATVDWNSVTGGTTVGIYVAGLDTALVRYNTVQGVKAPSSSLGGIVTDGKLTYLALVYGNNVSGIYGNGMRILNSDTAMVQVDSNLVSGSSADGIRLEGGADSITRNRITNNQIGVEITSLAVNYSRTLLTENNIVGNGFGVLQIQDGTYQATNNWWGDVHGPRCSSGCDSSVVGDSVTALGLLNFTPWALTEFGNTPSPAVRALPMLALRAPAIAAARAVPATGLNGALGPRPTPQRPLAVSSPRGTRPVAALRVPPGLSPVRAQAWQHAQQLRAAAATARMQREAAAQASSDSVEAAARQAREARVERERAQQEARRQARLARQAAARAALQAGRR